MNIIYRTLRLFVPSLFKVKTFTYFIPSPVQKQKGYQEKHFDQLIERIFTYGWQVTDHSTQAHEKGMWIVLFLTAKTPFSQNFDLDSDDQIEMIEGLYQIDSQGQPHDEL